MPAQTKRFFKILFLVQLSLITFLILIGSISNAVAAASTNILHEGWYSVTLAGQKVGYMVERYEFTADSKFKAVTFLKTNGVGGNITESLKAFSKSDLTPINYVFTSITGEKTKVIDASFKNDTMILKTIEDGTEKKSEKKIKKGTFLSTFVLYLILQQKNGLKVGKDYAYTAIAEEDGTVETGSAYIKSLDKVDGVDAFKVLNDFKDEKFFSWVTARGAIVMSRSPSKSIELKMVDRETAIKGIDYKESNIKLLFGDIPGSKSSAAPSLAKPSAKSEGTEVIGAGTSAEPSAPNSDVKISKDKKLLEKSPDESAVGIKGDKVDGGKGIEIKTLPTKPSTDTKAEATPPPKAE